MKAYYRKKYYSESDESNSNVFTKVISFMIDKPMNLVRNITIP